MKEKIEKKEQILETAAKLFLEKSIFEVDMKELARMSGCGRSTLYRYFPNKAEIVFALMMRDGRFYEKIEPVGMQFADGYAELEWKLRSVLDMILSTPDYIDLMCAYDAYFRQEYPQGPNYEAYMRYISKNELAKSTQAAIERGLADGSIRYAGDTMLLADSMLHALYGFAQRVLPREKFYRNEYGYARQMLQVQLELFLQALKNK